MTVRPAIIDLIEYVARALHESGVDLSEVNASKPGQLRSLSAGYSSAARAAAAAP